MDFAREVDRLERLMEANLSLPNKQFMELYKDMYLSDNFDDHDCRPTLDTDCPACEAKYDKVMEEVADAEN